MIVFSAFPTIVHAYVMTTCCRCMTEVVAVAVIVASSAYYVPGMSATIGGIECRTSKEEVVTVWIAAVDGEVPETVKPV